MHSLTFEDVYDVARSSKATSLNSVPHSNTFAVDAIK
jgi:hypothetical protein